MTFPICIISNILPKGKMLGRLILAPGHDPWQGNKNIGGLGSRLKDFWLKKNEIEIFPPAFFLTWLFISENAPYFGVLSHSFN